MKMPADTNPLRTVKTLNGPHGKLRLGIEPFLVGLKKPSDPLKRGPTLYRPHDRHGCWGLGLGSSKAHRTEAAKALTKPLERLGGTFPVLVGFRFLFLKLPLRIPQLMEVEHGVFLFFLKVCTIGGQHIFLLP